MGRVSCPGSPVWPVHGAGPGLWLQEGGGFQTLQRSRLEKTLTVLQLLSLWGLPSVGSAVPQPPGIHRPWCRDPKSSNGWGLEAAFQGDPGILRGHPASSPGLGAIHAPASSTGGWVSPFPSPSLTGCPGVGGQPLVLRFQGKPRGQAPVGCTLAGCAPHTVDPSAV